MERQSSLRVLTIKSLWGIFVRRFFIMLFAALIVVGSVMTISNMNYVPKYKSTATLYILRQNENRTDNVSADFSLALDVVKDCTYLLKSHTVLDKVIDDLDLSIPYEELYESISAVNPDNTRILEVTVENESPELAKAIVDNICKIGATKIKSTMGFDQVNVYEYGTLNNEPYNKLGLAFYILCGVITAFVIYIIFLIAYLLDDRIRTDDEIELNLKLSILGNIPNIHDTKRHRYKYYLDYGKKKKSKKSKKSDNRKED